MNGLQTLPQWREYFGRPDGALLGLMNAVYPLGTVVALLCLPYITDRSGRRWPLLFGLVTCICFSILQGLAQSLDSFVVARAFLGFFTAFLSQPSPILIAEVAYPTHRGKVTALYNTFYVSANIMEPTSRDESICLQNLRSTLVPYLLPGKHFLPMNNPLTDASRERSDPYPPQPMRTLPLGASFMTPGPL